MIILLPISIFCADVATTWWLLVHHHRQVREAGKAGTWLVVFGFHGHLIFVCIRIAALGIFATYGGVGAAIGWSALTLYAVINNLVVLRRLKK